MLRTHLHRSRTTILAPMPPQMLKLLLLAHISTVLLLLILNKGHVQQTRISHCCSDRLYVAAYGSRQRLLWIMADECWSHVQLAIDCRQTALSYVRINSVPQMLVCCWYASLITT